MWKAVSSTLNACHRRRSSWIKYCYQGKRFILSEAYRCQESWENRLQTPILQNINLDELFTDLESKYLQEGKASAIDVDLFANALNDDSHIEELEDAIHKLRLSPNTVETFPSTHHAVIRLFLALKKDEELLQILNDRLNYGIFPDNYCSSLLMDSFIKNENYTAAAQVGVLQMLQEDWSDPLTANLALYSCHMHLKSPGKWYTGSEETPDPSNTEEVKVRVKFLRNPFFDDHFDLQDPDLLVGKTLASLGETMPDQVGNTYRLVGLNLYQKWDQCATLLQQFLSKKESVFSDGIKLFEELLNKQPAEGNEPFQEIKTKLLALLEEMKSSNLVSADDLHKAVVEKVEQNAKRLEAEAIDAQKKTYLVWEKDRLEALQQQIEARNIQQRLARVREEKLLLEKKEKELFYFDNEEKWELEIASKQKFYPKRYFGKKKKPRVKDENYVPPEI